MATELRDQLQQSLGSTYTLGQELAGGGMSRVFLAHDAQLDRKVVVKVLSPDLAAGVNSERFKRFRNRAGGSSVRRIRPSTCDTKPSTMLSIFPVAGQAHE